MNLLFVRSPKKHVSGRLPTQIIPMGRPESGSLWQNPGSPRATRWHSRAILSRSQDSLYKTLELKKRAIPVTSANCQELIITMPPPALAKMTPLFSAPEQQSYPLIEETKNLSQLN